MNIPGCTLKPYKFDDKGTDKHMKKTQVEHAFL